MTRALIAATIAAGAAALSACGDDAKQTATVTVPAQTVTASRAPQTATAAPQAS